MHEREREHEEELRLKQNEDDEFVETADFDEEPDLDILNTLSAALGVDEDVPAILDDDEEPEMVSLDEIIGTSDEAIG